MSVDSNDGTTPKKLGGITGKGFKPGTCPNPGGKSPEREELRRYLVSEYGRTAIDGIAEMARSARSEKVRLDARIWLGEQAIGRALVAVSGEDGKPIKIDLDVLGKLQNLAAVKAVK